jgi:hypothetical protein
MTATAVAPAADNTATAVAPAVEENVIGAAVETSGDLLQGEEAPAPVEISYTDFKVPDGTEIAEENLAMFKEMAKSAGLSQEQAQKVLEAESKNVQAAKEAAELYKAQEQKAWVDELKKDPVYGGRNLGETVERANRSLRKFGSPELIQLLKETGYANNAHVVRLFANIDKSTSESRLVEGVGTPVVKSTADLIYDNTKV